MSTSTYLAKLVETEPWNIIFAIDISFPTPTQTPAVLPPVSVVLRSRSAVLVLARYLPRPCRLPCQSTQQSRVSAGLLADWRLATGLIHN